MKTEIGSLKSIKNRIKTNGEELKRLDAKKSGLVKKADSIGREIELCGSEKKSVLDRYVREEISDVEFKKIQTAHENLIVEEKEIQEFLEAVNSAIEELKREEKSLLTQLAEAEKKLFGSIFVELQEKFLSSIGTDGLLRVYAAYCLSGGMLFGKDFLDRLFESVWRNPYGIYGPDMSKVNEMSRELLNEFTGKKEIPFSS